MGIKPVKGTNTWCINCTMMYRESIQYLEIQFAVVNRVSKKLFRLQSGVLPSKRTSCGQRTSLACKQRRSCTSGVATFNSGACPMARCHAEVHQQVLNVRPPVRHWRPMTSCDIHVAQCPCPCSRTFLLWSPVRDVWTLLEIFRRPAILNMIVDDEVPLIWCARTGATQFGWLIYRTGALPSWQQNCQRKRGRLHRWQLPFPGTYPISP